MPCDEKISDPEAIKAAIQSHPVIQALNSEWTLRDMVISPCFTNGKASVTITYQLPAAYSEFQVIYFDQFSLACSKGGTIELATGANSPSEFDQSALEAYFKGKINEIESNPRVREVIVKTKPDPLNPANPISGQATIFRSGYNRVEYNFFYGLVRGYMLSNDIDWREFPEIEQAHQVIQEHLLIGDLAGCVIGTGDAHSYTEAKFHDSVDAPWNLTVAISCPDGWKDAAVRINPDGTYEELRIATDY